MVYPIQAFRGDILATFPFREFQESISLACSHFGEASQQRSLVGGAIEGWGYCNGWNVIKRNRMKLIKHMETTCLIPFHVFHQPLQWAHRSSQQTPLLPRKHPEYQYRERFGFVDIHVGISLPYRYDMDSLGQLINLHPDSIMHKVCNIPVTWLGDSWISCLFPSNSRNLPTSILPKLFCVTATNIPQQTMQYCIWNGNSSMSCFSKYWFQSYQR